MVIFKPKKWWQNGDAVIIIVMLTNLPTMMACYMYFGMYLYTYIHTCDGTISETI